MAQGDLEPPPHRGIQWTDRGSQPVREESEALWSWLHLVPPLSTARTPSCRWCHLAAAAAPIPDQDPRSLLKRVGPVMIEAMTVNVEAQFRSLRGPLGWLFHVAAMTASPV